MKTEKLKVQENGGNLNKPNELAILINEVFECTTAGKKLLHLLKEIYISNKNHAVIWPVNPEILKKFGSEEVYSGFRSGQASVIFQIEQLIEQYKQIVANQTKPKE